MFGDSISRPDGQSRARPRERGGEPADASQDRDNGSPGVIDTTYEVQAFKHPSAKRAPAMREGSIAKRAKPWSAPMAGDSRNAGVLSGLDGTG